MSRAVTSLDDDHTGRDIPKNKGKIKDVSPPSQSEQLLAISIQPVEVRRIKRRRLTWESEPTPTTHVAALDAENVDATATLCIPAPPEARHKIKSHDKPIDAPQHGTSSVSALPPPLFLAPLLGQARPAECSAARLHIGNVSYLLTEEHVRQLFRSFGGVTQVVMPMDHVAHRHRGFAFVEFARAEDATKAMAAMEGVAVAGR